MNRNLIFLPLLLQVFTTLFAYSMLRVRKNRASSAGLVNEARRALHDDAWPEDVLQINNNIRNQFELPTLFYVLSLVIWCLDYLGPVGLFSMALFSLSRVIHLYVHTGSNVVPLRRFVFTFGLATVVLLFLVASAGALRSALA